MPSGDEPAAESGEKLMTLEEARREFERAHAAGLVQLLVQAAQNHGIDGAVALGLGSRETNLTNELGDGDNGVGVCQVDRRFHIIAQQAFETGSWRTDPGPLIDFAMGLLAGNVAWAQSRFPEFDAVKIALSAYNAGQGGAARGVAEGDSDRFTTGGNYGRDTLQRAELFRQLLGEPAASG
jgi:hypothetical protein